MGCNGENCKCEKKSKLLVAYIGVAGIRTEDLSHFMQEVGKRITPQLFNGEIILIPQQSSESRIECIDPKYITKEELIIKNNELMVELNEQLNHQLQELKENNEEKN